MSVKDPGKGGTDVATEDRVTVQRPKNHKVLLHNDDFTTQQFVVHVLMKFFRKTETEATQVMLMVHHSGMAVAGVYPAEVAEAKVAQVTDYARGNNYPLKVTAEPE